MGWIYITLHYNKKIIFISQQITSAPEGGEATKQPILCQSQIFCTEEQNKSKSCKDCEDGDFEFREIWNLCMCLPDSLNFPIGSSP